MSATRIGYARTSTAEQRAGLDAQERELSAGGCEKIFSEQVSSVDKSRPELARALEYARPGDEFMVMKPDRLARSLKDLLAIEERLRAKGVTLIVQSMGLNTKDATGRLILQVLGAIAEFERALMLERQIEGIAEAKAAGKYRGRKPTAQAKAAEVVRLADERDTSGRNPRWKKTEIAAQLGISRASVHRILASVPEKPAGNCR